MTHTEIVKEKLKEIERIDKLKEDMTSKCWLSSQLRINRFKIEGELSGMQTAIKSELEWLKLHRDSDNACFNLKNLKPKSKKLEEGYKASLECQIGIYDKRITDCKNALKLIEEKRQTKKNKKRNLK